MPCPDMTMKPIGIIHTPFRLVSDNIPIQGRLVPGAPGRIELFSDYAAGCRDIEGFSYCYLLYYFHTSMKERMMTKPYLDSEKRGVYSTRSPHRPNHIGLSLVRIIRVNGGIIDINDADMLDETPLLDIKPYIPLFDSMSPGEAVRYGWMEKHGVENIKNRTTKTGSYKEWLQVNE